jgi:uncharacterized FAD-dependent dehydrogenase
MLPHAKLRLTEIRLPLDHDAPALEAAVRARLGEDAASLVDFSVFRRAVDARKRSAIKLSYTIDVALSDPEARSRLAAKPGVRPAPDTTYRFVAQAPANLAERPIVIGTGPCGLMAGLILAQMGFRPIILERGRVVRRRTQDTWGLWRRGVLDPDSNVQFGEGGAGTFSDGKLWSQIKDPHHLGRKVLDEFVTAGAPPEILYEAHPHIGTFRLVTMVESIRATIEKLGGEYRFETKVVDLLMDDHHGAIRGVVLENGETLLSRHVVLAIGHSARETFTMLEERGVHVESKPFSIGVRIEHPQSLIDRDRWGDFAGNKLLGAAEYRLVHHCETGIAAGRSVYSFCMCPGGTVVAATSETGRVVTNGMSQYSRNERNANSGLVVGLTPQDYPGGLLSGVQYQRHWEELAFVAGGSNYNAPAQLVGDFLAGRPSTAMGAVVPSYKPGVTPTDLSLCLPDFVIAALREALPAFGRDIKGYDMADAVMTGVETRTSAPVRITRGADYQSISTPGLYPAGEGAGYAGGIFSAGVDGIRVAEALALDMVSPLSPA